MSYLSDMLDRFVRLTGTEDENPEWMQRWSRPGNRPKKIGQSRGSWPSFSMPQLQWQTPSLSDLLSRFVDLVGTEDENPAWMGGGSKTPPPDDPRPFYHPDRIAERRAKKAAAGGTSTPGGATTYKTASGAGGASYTPPPPPPTWFRRPPPPPPPPIPTGPRYSEIRRRPHEQAADAIRRRNQTASERYDARRERADELHRDGYLNRRDYHRERKAAKDSYNQETGGILGRMSGTSIGRAIGVIALIEGIRRLTAVFAERTLEARREQAQYSGATAGAFARMEYNDIARGFAAAQVQSQHTVELVQAVDEMKTAMGPLKNAAMIAMTEIAIKGAQFVTFMTRAITDGMKAIGWLKPIIENIEAELAAANRDAGNVLGNQFHEHLLRGQFHNHAPRRPIP